LLSFVHIKFSVTALLYIISTSIESSCLPFTQIGFPARLTGIMNSVRNNYHCNMAK